MFININVLEMNVLKIEIFVFVIKLASTVNSFLTTCYEPVT